MPTTGERPPTVASHPVAPPARSLRLSAGILAAKTVGSVARRLGRGGGTALPGIVAERMVPGVVGRLGNQFGRGVALITGTNGKTTSTAMLAAIAHEAAIPVVHNRSGSNLMRGMAATLVAATNTRGQIDDAGDKLAVLEIDEATLLQMVAAVEPSTMTFLNLFRDQLDRYGEVDTIFARWRQTVGAVPAACTLVLNADDPTVAALGEDGTRPAITFGIDDTSVAIPEQEHASDARWCHVCGTEYTYAALYAGHVGLWSCDGCGRRRQPPDVAATAVRLNGFDGSELMIRTPDGILQLTLYLGGLYNVYNALAAIATATAYGIPLDAIERALEAFKPAFGRQERFVIDGRGVRILLGKNPAGLNQVLRLLAALPGRKTLLVILNDGIADGTDVSWIWDVDYEPFAEQLEGAVIAGTRAAEMAVRLKYAGWGAGWPVIRAIPAALREALRQTPPASELYVVPTYTAMLEVRELLAKMAGEGHFWDRK